jgi:hypothetical protein
LKPFPPGIDSKVNVPSFGAKVPAGIDFTEKLSPNRVVIVNHYVH